MLIPALAAMPATLAAQRLDDVVPVGVHYVPDADPARRRSDLEEIRRLRFNVVALSTGSPTDMELGIVERLLAGAPDARIRASGIATIAGQELATAEHVRQAAWYAISLGARGVIFGDWKALAGNAGALTAAVEFADHVSRNAALYAPLRPRVGRPGPPGSPGSPGSPDVVVAGGDPRITARFLESYDALVFVAINHDPAAAHEVTFTFSPEMPEAIWQNMLTGAAVHFVAGPAGPAYTRTLAPRDVLVLMIRKKWK
jgi:hypothetical protein